MKRFYTILAAALFVMPAVASAQEQDSTARILTRITPSPRTDTLAAQTPDWGGQPPAGGYTAELIWADDGLGGHLGCGEWANAGDVAGKIAFIQRGVCGFSVKAYWAEQAGAIAFVVHNDDRLGDADCSLVGMSGVDSVDAVTISGGFMSRCVAVDYIALFLSGAVMVNFNQALIVAIEPGGPLVGEYEVFGARPNPFTTSTEFGVRTARTQDIRVEVFNTIGQRVALLHDGALAGGDVHTFSLAAANLPSGVYLYRVTGESFVETRNVVLAR